MTQDSPTPAPRARWIPAGALARGLTAVVLVVVIALGGLLAIGGQKVELDGARPVLADLDAPDVPDGPGASGRAADAEVSGGGVLAPGVGPDDVAMTIGDVEVPVSRLQQTVRVLRGLYGIAVPTEADQADTFRREVAKTVAVTTVLQQQAQARDVTVPDDQVDAQFDNVVQQSFGGDREAFIGRLEQEGLSEDDVRREIGDQLRALALFQQVTADVEGPSDARIQTFYDSNRDALTIPQRRLISVILQPGEGRANQVLDRLRSGAPFEEVAKQVSTDEATKAQGGDLGSVTQEQLPPALADPAFQTAPGALFGPVQVQGGWAIGVVRRVVPPRPMTLEESTEQIRATLLDRSRQATWGRFLTRAVGDAEVIYADDYLPADPDAIDLQAPGSSDPREGDTP